ncbi:MAG: zinc ribbon domain-containing protein [Leptolinea sp.]
MPVYEYICPKCASEFEKRLSFSEADQPQDCPACGSKNNKKKLSLFASSLIGGSSATSTSSAGCGGGGRFT